MQQKYVVNFKWIASHVSFTKKTNPQNPSIHHLIRDWHKNVTLVCRYIIIIWITCYVLRKVKNLKCGAMRIYCFVHVNYVPK